MDIKKEYERWLENATADANVAAELKTLDNAKIEDAFYRDLAFGTGGLRGVIGAGTNRMNIYTVAKASQGLADYLKKNFAEPSVAIGYDSRIKSDVFAKVAAGVFAANGVKVNMSLKAIGDELLLNPIKVRKLLITAEVYKSEIAEKVKSTFDECETKESADGQQSYYCPGQ